MALELFIPQNLSRGGGPRIPIGSLQKTGLLIGKVLNEKYHLKSNDFVQLAFDGSYPNIILLKKCAPDAEGAVRVSEKSGSVTIICASFIRAITDRFTLATIKGAKLYPSEMIMAGWHALKVVQKGTVK